jgi:hypothetical protein
MIDSMEITEAVAATLGIAPNGDVIVESVHQVVKATMLELADRGFLVQVENAE